MNDGYELDGLFAPCGMCYGELDDNAIEEMASWSFTGGGNLNQIALVEGMPHWALIQAMDEENPA